MGGATVTIQENTLVDAIEKLNEKIREAEHIPLWLNSITMLVKNKKGKYVTFGNHGIELSIGTCYTENEFKNFVIFAHFGK